ncbi:MAG: ATP-binding cassette domain-containing protein [Desulfotignum sp.]
MKIINARTKNLYISRFEALPGQAWCIWGTNRSGIDDFFSLVSEQKIDAAADTLKIPEKPGVVSFKDQQKIYEAELKKDQTDFLDRLDPGTPAREFLKDAHRYTRLIQALGMTDCLEQGYRQLSSGQARKLMILSQITTGASCLVVQAPFEGLDPDSCRELDKALFHLFSQKIQLLLFVHNQADIPSWTTHLAIVANGSLKEQGPAEKELATIRTSPAGADFTARVQDLDKTQNQDSEKLGNDCLIQLYKGCAGYQGQPVFTNLDLVMNQGDHTLVTGPNGSGKSTLLQVITGDHPACYTNDLTIFGVRRGTGESIWDVKQNMGIMGSDLHRNFRASGSVLACILSGLFDTIGLYTRVTPAQKHLAMEWLERVGLNQAAATAFRDLGHADQRLVLIARALIKTPRLLVLDEPTQGLDELNRSAILDFLAEVARENLGTILYVSHREDEFRPFFCRHIRMEKTGVQTTR